MPFRYLPGAKQCYFQPGESLIRFGEELEYVYYLESGEVYCNALTKEGHAFIFSRKVGGQGVSSLIGILTAYSDPPFCSIHEIIAHTECMCYQIPRKVCIAYLHRHPELLESLLLRSVNDYTNLSKKYWVNKEKNAPSALCTFLLENSQEVGGKRVLPKQYTNVKIANFLSVHRVTVNNMLRTLKEEGCVERTSQGLVLNNLSLLNEYSARKRKLNY